MGFLNFVVKISLTQWLNVSLKNKQTKNISDYCIITAIKPVLFESVV